MKNLKARILCRVSDVSQQDLLFYQKEVLTDLITHSNLELVGVHEEISKGSCPYSSALRTLKTHIRRKDFDVLLVYDWTRISIYEDLYTEFKMLCDMNHVLVFSLHEFKSTFMK